MEKKKVGMGILAAAILVVLAVVLWGWYSDRRQLKELKSQLNDLQIQEKRSAILRSVSSQMQDIALEQREISDKQREEALHQTQVANEMRQQSEQERQKAVSAQQAAVASERRALDAYKQADWQRELAHQQRQQAEHSKRVADTLSFVNLGRSLGSLAISQTLTGNQEMAAMLGYASYLFTERYGGDVYYPAVFQALTLCSQSRKEWKKHAGAVGSLVLMPGETGQMVTAGHYGEVLLHERTADGLKTTVLFKDSRYDFRSAYADSKNGQIYAVSRNGYLYIRTSAGERLLPLDMMSHPMALQHFRDERSLLIVGDDGLAKLDMTTNTIVGSRRLDFNVTFANRYDYAPALFDDKGRMHIVRDIDRMEVKKVPVVGRVTAFASSKNKGYEIYGMDNGTIFLVDRQYKIHQLTGHRSQISWLKANGPTLYSSSYDGTVRLWRIDNEKIEPMTLLSTNRWLLFFTFDPSKNYLWTCDQGGYLTETMVSTAMMAEKIHQKIGRNLSREEWDYYIGKDVPYEMLMTAGGKEGTR